MSVSEIVQRLERLEEHCKIEATKVARLWRMHEGVLPGDHLHLAPSPATLPGETAGVRSEAEPWKTYNPLPVSLDSVAHAAPAASGAAGTEPVSVEPVAWGVMVDGKIDRTPFAEAIFLEKATAESWCRIDSLQGKGTLVPLYAAPQPASGWLTAEQREAVQAVILSAGKTAVCNDCCRSLDQAQTILRQLEVARSILARSSPPQPAPNWLTPEERGSIQLAANIAKASLSYSLAQELENILARPSGPEVPNG